ncbi:MAG TPA: sigma factor, partial [Parasegetibacter sp.]
MPLVLHNETQLVRDMQSGCEDAFTALYKFYSPRLYLNILAMIRDPLAAEEIVQELFTRVWQKRHYKGISENFPGYLYKIGQRLVLDFFRKMKRDQTLMDKFRNAASENFEDIHDELYQKQFATILERAISQLSP